MEIYGATGYIDTLYEDHNPGVKLRIRLHGESSEHVETAPPLTSPQNNSLNYLAAVLNGTLHPEHDLTALDTNVTVVRILDAARRSAQTGRSVSLAGSSAIGR
jgi:predicted dehydrogenase